MLNRIYIIVGMLAIIVLASAFIVPHFVRWSDYRSRMEELATAMLGTPVTVRGEIDFTLLPQPRLRFHDVLVGSTEEPAATVDAVEAEFSLMDFLRDNYTITRLALDGPVIDFTVDQSGLLGSGVTIGQDNAGIGLAQASVRNATVRLIDERSGENFVADNVTGDLRLSNFQGPFSFSGTGTYRGAPYSVRVSASALDGAGQARLSTFIQPQAGDYTFSADGQFSPGMAPKFDGTLIYRQRPRAADAAQDIRGDLVLEAQVTGSTDRVVLSNYTLQPDQNRAGTRLTGAASIQLGAARSFDAVISGGVFSLPPRDANEDSSQQPYELVRLLADLPAPIVPPMAGRIGVDLAEVGLRGFSLRNVRMDASTDGSSWTVEQFIAQLPGDSRLRLDGQLGSENNRPSFRGNLSLTSTRLDGLGALWRKPDENSPLFNVPASLTGRVMLAGDAFGINNGLLSIEQQSHGVELRLGFGDEKRLDLVGHFADLSANDSAILAALLPPIGGDIGFANSFPEGSFSLTGTRARLFDLDGTGLVAEGRWQAGEISFSRFSADDWGGVGFDTTLTARGPVKQPALSGSGLLRIDTGDAPALARLYDLAGVPASWRTALAQQAPADLLVNVEAPIDGAQTVTAQGSLGVGDLNVRAELSGGLSALTTAPLRVTGGLESTDIAGLTNQLGLGAEPIFAGQGSMLLSFGLAGAPSDSLVGSVTASLGNETISYSGNLLPGANGQVNGTGTLNVQLEDAGVLAQILGGGGISLPPASGEAQLQFTGNQTIALSAMNGTSGEEGFSGNLTLNRVGALGNVGGNLALDNVSAEGLAAALFGPAALVGGEGSVWPHGPLAGLAEQRQTRGAIAVTANGLSAGGVERFGATTFDFAWDETRTRLTNFEAASGNARLNLDIAVCCAGPLAERAISGRINLTDVPIETIAPPAVSAALGGRISGGVSFEGNGASLADALAATSGEGNFTLADFAVGQLSPQVYPTVAALDDVLNTDPDALSAIMGLALAQGAFNAADATGAFTLAGGVLRLANFIIDGEGAQLDGGVNLALGDLGLAGNFVMTPTDFSDENGLVGSDTARVITRLAGTLVVPQVTLDLEEMVAAILVRANELEVDRLEALRLEDEARQRAAAEERNRLIAEQKRQAAEIAAQRAAAEEAERMLLLQQQQERLQLELQQQLQVAPAPDANAPMSPSFEFVPPPVNQPVGNGFNIPLTTN